jgi:ATP-dependent RNA helicase RhlB
LGAEGDAISFACDLYAMSLPDIEAYIGQKIPVAAVEPDMLVMPKPREIDPEFAAAVAADSAAFGDHVEPRGDAKKPARGGGSRRRDGGRGSREGGRGGERGPRESRGGSAPRAAEAAVPAETATATAPAPAGAAGEAAAASADGAPKRRRRRGGRGRRRNNGEAAAATANPGNNAAPAAAGSAARGGNRPARVERAPRERAAAESAGHPRPSRQVEAQSGLAPAAKKPGLFRRLSRLFTGR